MIDLHYWPTPNGWKISIMLEECGLPYRVMPVNIGRGEQFEPEFLAISPNNRMPAIVDHDPPGGGAPVSVFESGAILHLPGREDRALPARRPARPHGHAAVADVADGRPRADGRAERPLPLYAPEKIPYAHRALREGGQPPVRRARPAAAAHRRLRRRRRLLDRRHGHLPVGAHRTRRSRSPLDDFAARQALVRCSAAAPRGAPRHRRSARNCAPAAPGTDDEARKACSARPRRTLRDAATRPPERMADDRILLRLLQPLDLPGLPQHPAAGRRSWGAASAGARSWSAASSTASTRASTSRASKPVPAKRAYMIKDLQDWARWSGLELKFPPTVFPVNSVKAMRGCLVLEPRGPAVPGSPARSSRPTGATTWTSRRTRCCARSAGAAGVDADALLGRHRQPCVKDAAARQHRRADRARRLRLADDLRRRRRHVLRQRPPAAGARRPAAALVRLTARAGFQPSRTTTLPSTWRAAIRASASGAWSSATVSLT